MSGFRTICSKNGAMKIGRNGIDFVQFVLNNRARKIGRNRINFVQSVLKKQSYENRQEWNRFCTICSKNKTRKEAGAHLRPRAVLS